MSVSFRLAGGLWLLLSAWTLAQDARPAPGPSAAVNSDAAPREQTIYIPYAKLRQIFEKEGRGVFVPYEEFQRLWKAARAAAKRTDDPEPPVTAIINQIDSTATVQHDVMQVQATLQIEVLAEGWHYVHLRLNDAVVSSAKIGDEPARLIFEAGKGYWVLLDKQGKEPEKFALTLEYSKAFSKQPGSNSVSFEAPQAPVNRWQVRIPEPGVKVRIEPNVSTTEVKRDRAEQPVAAVQETEVQAFVGAAPAVKIEWTAKAEGAAGLAALVSVEVRQELTIEDALVRTRAHLAYDIQRAGVAKLTIEVPADQQVVNVFDANLQKWEKTAAGDLQLLTLTLFQPTRGTQNITIELEKFAGDKEMPGEMTSADIRAPVVRAVQAGTDGGMANVGRQQGIVLARLGASLRGEATTRTGLLQIDAADLPAPLAKQGWTFAYRYASVPYELVLSVEKLLPRIEATELAEIYVEPEQITTNLVAVFDIQRAGVFQLELEVPEGSEVRSLQGREVAGAAALAIDSHHLEDVEYVPNPAQPDVKAKQRTKLVVQLAKRALGQGALWVELVKRQADANLREPTGAISVVSLPLVRVAPASVARSTGRAIVYAPESLRINPKEAKGLLPLSPAEAVQAIPSARGDRFPQLNTLVAYGYTHEAALLVVEAQRRKPSVEARQLIVTHVEPGVVRYQATFFFDIKYSGVRSLRLDVPAALADQMRSLTTTLREQQVEPAPADVAPGDVAWLLTGEGELIGNVVAKFTWENKQGDLPVGQSVAIDVPHFKAVSADRSWGQIVASKAETIEISVRDEPRGLRPIDPERDLMPGASVPGAARAFEFHEDWSLALQATRYQLEEVKRTSVEKALVRMVVTRGDKVAVQALYRLRSARQRIPVKLPGVDPKSAALALDSQPLRINNHPAPLEHDGTQFFIPLVGHSAYEPVLVELRYTIEGSSSRLLPPEFVDDPAMQQVDLGVWLPEEWKLLGVIGPWTHETGPRWFDQAERPDPPDDETLLADLRSGLASCESAGDGFPLDGRRRLFRTLRPEAGEAGALSLTTAHRNVVSAAVFLLVAIAGLMLTPRPVGVRLWWLAGLVIATVLLAVFAPTLAEALLGTSLWLAIGLVLLVWGVRSLAWLFVMIAEWSSTRLRLAAAAAQAPQAAPAVVEGGQAHV